MGNSNSSVETNYLEQIKKIDEDEKTRTDVLLIKSVKELVVRVEKLEKEKQNKLIYQLPKLQLCNWSLIWTIGKCVMPVRQTVSIVEPIPFVVIRC